jgi:pyridoxal phosphate enzyme (YggS family)
VQEICERINKLRAQIRAAEIKYSRKVGAVTLLAATKTRSVAEIGAAVACGQKHFGENYLQDALPKIQMFPSYHEFRSCETCSLLISPARNEFAQGDSRGRSPILPLENPPSGKEFRTKCETRTYKNYQSTDIIWHFIGAIQSNKTKIIAENFVWVESLARLKIAQRLNAQRPDYLPPLNVCIEVNLSGETNKSGVQLTQILPLAQAIRNMPRLKLRGLMAIPAFHDDFVQQRQLFSKLTQALQRLNESGFTCDTLSMGMSHDFEAAIAAGATIVRIGTAIFGERV